LLSVFGAAALLLAAVGLGALVAATVARRTREIGVRMALGATGAGVVRAQVAAAGRRVLAGLGLGGAAVVAFAGDLAALAGAALLLAAVALGAAWLPARRAARVDPAVALRAE